MFSLLTFLFFTLTSANPTFDEWLVQYNRSYTTLAERNHRHAVYNANVKRIDDHNKGNHTWIMGVNQFADLSATEFKKMVGGCFKSPAVNRRQKKAKYSKKHIAALPSSVDWRTSGAVTAVKDQGQCGSCWAFSTTGSVESAYFLKNGTLQSLSEQQLVDCSVKEGNQGCNGGLMDYGFQYVIDNKGLTSEAAYPYTATGPNTCVSTGKPVAAKISGFKDVPTKSEVALMTAIAQQPVSVAVEANQNSFQFYKDGVMTQACGSNLDHGVLAVGYGTLGGKDYYLVKNSWGTSWGKEGYIMLGRGANYGGEGQCGIQMDPSYPVV